MAEITLDQAEQAWSTWQRHGGPSVTGAQSAACKELGIHRTTMRLRAKKWREYQNIDPAIQNSMSRVGTQLVPALTWVKTKEEDGVSYSVLLNAAEVIEEPDDIL